MRKLVLILCLVLSGCGGVVGAEWSTEQDAYADDDPTPNVTNDGFYDGGVFDQDMLGRAPGDIM